MVAALPRPVRLKLERTLSQWRQWRCDPPLTDEPRVVSVLGQGLSNFSILVGDKPGFVVRIDGINPASHGLNRQSEWRALLTASDAGLAPEPRYFNPEMGSLVCDYLPAEQSEETRPGDIAALLRGIHALPARHHRLDLGERIQRYEKQLEHAGRQLPGGLTNTRPEIFSMLADTGRHQDRHAVLCHNDLLQANRIVSGGRLWAIDWEYCAMGSPWYDLAVVSAGDALTAAQTGELLKAYLGRPWTGEEWTMLHRHECLYRYIEILWYLANGRDASDPALAKRLEELEQALLSP